MLQAVTTNEDLLRRVRNWREDEGWCEFYRLYAPAITAHALRSGLKPEEADDVVQTTMIKVATYLPKFEYDKTVCRFRTWLNQIVNQRIVAIWQLRSRSRLPEAALVYLADVVASAAHAATDPEVQMELQEQMLSICLARVRAEVKPRHWQVFQANAIDGFDAKTVAARFGTTAPNVWIIRHRIIRRLRLEWKELLNHPFKFQKKP